jgi:hypothetical protein
MKNFIGNYYAWEQAQEIQYENLRRQAWQRLSLLAFLILRIAKNIIILLFLSESRLIRIHDEHSRVYEGARRS